MFLIPFIFWFFGASVARPVDCSLKIAVESVEANIPSEGSPFGLLGAPKTDIQIALIDTSNKPRFLTVKNENDKVLTLTWPWFVRSANNKFLLRRKGKDSLGDFFTTLPTQELPSDIMGLGVRYSSSAGQRWTTSFSDLFFIKKLSSTGIREVVEFNVFDPERHFSVTRVDLLVSWQCQ